MREWAPACAGATNRFHVVTPSSLRKLRDTEGLNRALAALGSQPAEIATPDDHQTDALVAAAGLRAIAGDGRYWQPAGMTAAVARTEGWTLGVL
ncbi:hypothetical protein [Pacificimonas flava]|uniref:hypothetical protein n=1 Tax=Pacificimonas flava TaxID=1234595 RepID=UPI0016109F7D|nr:hypothetical protein [Pacificimonas flava]MBB5280402.1 hypothetical protein [Pacificimonas flava]